MASIINRILPTAQNGGYGFSHIQCPDLTGKVALVTGGTNGIGLSFARTLYQHNASLVLLSSSQQVGQQALAYIKSGNLDDAPPDYREGFGSQRDTSGDVDGGAATAGSKGSVEFIQCDLERLKEVNNVAVSLKKRLERLDLFVGIAGKGVNAFTLTPEGLDSHLALNNLSHHVLLSHLLPLLKETSEKPHSDVRIVNMSSELHRATLGGPGSFGGKFRDVKEFKEDVGQSNLYARTKLCVILFTKAVLQRHLSTSADAIKIFATHPGAVATGQQGQFKAAYGEIAGQVMAAATRPFMRTPDQGSLSILWAAVALEAKTWQNGTYFSDPGEDGKESEEGDDQELIDNFYVASEKVIDDIVGESQKGIWV